MSFRVVSYYTSDTIYEEIMKTYLQPCLNFFEIPHFIFAIKDLGNWKANSLLQASIIGLAMKTFPNEDIVWIDADCIIRGKPILFDQIPKRCEIGLYYMTYEDHFGIPPKGVPAPYPELSTSVIYIKNCPKMLTLIEKWMLSCENLNTNKRIKLSNIVNEQLKEDLSFFVLPRNYAYLTEREDSSLPAITLKDPIICHFEASKHAKKDLYDMTPFLGDFNAS